jgi:chromate transporter
MTHQPHHPSPESSHEISEDIFHVRPKPSLLALAWYFFWIAVTTVQGAAGHMRRQIVEVRKLISEREFLDSFALAEFLPQPDSTFGLAVHVGHRVRGFSGALVTAIAMITPAFLMAVILGTAFIHFHNLPWVNAFAAGAGAGVCAVIGCTVLEIGKKAVIDYRDLILILIAFVLLRYGILHISGVLLWVTPLALWLHRPSRHEKLKGFLVPPGMVPTPEFRHLTKNRLEHFFQSEHWGTLRTAILVLALMGVVFIAEKGGPELFKKIWNPLHQGEKTMTEQVCPAIPIKRGNDAFNEKFPVAPVCVDLVSTFSALSVCAFGGEETILPCMQHASVNNHQWMDHHEFVDLFAMSYIIPGPSMLVSFIGLKSCADYGEHWAIIGALVAMFALFIPNLVVILAAANSWDWLKGWRWRASVGKALLLIAAGALSAAFMLITESEINSTTTVLMAIGSAILLLFTELNPVVIILLCGTAGLMFLN